VSDRGSHHPFELGHQFPFADADWLTASDWQRPFGNGQSMGKFGQLQSLATGRFLASHQAIVAPMKRARRVHAGKHKHGKLSLDGLLSGAHGQRRTAPQMPTLVANPGRACNSLTPGLRYPAATITCA
jgi:hypothetical protein